MRYVAIVLLFACSVVGQSGPANLNFESGEAGSIPQGWKAPSMSGATSPGRTVKLTQDHAKEGKFCAELASEPGAPGFGNLMQTFDATAYRGKRVRFRAAVRAD